MVEKTGAENLKIKGSGFIIENTGNIKDYYKISSCIGRGTYHNYTVFETVELLLILSLRSFW